MQIAKVKSKQQHFKTLLITRFTPFCQIFAAKKGIALASERNAAFGMRDYTRLLHTSRCEFLIA